MPLLYLFVLVFVVWVWIFLECFFVVCEGFVCFLFVGGFGFFCLFFGFLVFFFVCLLFCFVLFGLVCLFVSWLFLKILKVQFFI